MKKRLYLVAVLLLVVFSCTMFFLTRFNKSSLIARDGFFVTGEKLDEVLLSSNKIAKTENVFLKKITDNDTFYLNSNKVFIGDEKKIEVNTIYPLYINNGLGIVNLDVKSKLINKNFEYFDTYENFTLTGGKLYNFGDYEQSDYEDYILLQLSNGTYINALDMEINTINGKHKIPINSIINFQENYFNYYYYKNGKLVYKIIDGLNLSDTLMFGDYKYTYEDFLVKLGKIEKVEKEDDNLVVEETDQEDYLITDGEYNTSNNSKDEEKEKKYIAPKVSCTNFSANVYSAKTKLSISDPSRVIVGGINFQFYVNDKVFLRKTFITGGNIEVIGLVPNTTFKIVGTYKYYNEESKKMEMTFFEQELTTLGVENLDPISLEFNNGDIYPNKIELKDFGITSDLESETIKGINKGVIIINGEQYSIPTSSLNQMINGKKVTYTSPAKIDSNTKIDYEIKFLDAYSNEIKVINNRGSTRTSKNSPTASVKVTDSAVNSVTFVVTLKNIDNVNISNFRYVIYNINGNIVEQNRMDSKENSNSVTLKNLDPNSVYSIQIFGDYDNENGQGTMSNQLMGEGKFTTAPLSSLGFFRVVATPNDLTYHSVTISSTLDVNNVSSILIELLNTLTVEITDEEENVIYTHTYKGNELNDIRAGADFEISIDELNSVSTYNINYSATVKQGSVTESVNVLCSLKNFKTYKQDATIELRNEFVTANMIDFDVRVVDIDSAVESGRVLLEIRNSKGDLVGKEYLDLNADFVQLTYTKLDEDETYTFSYIAEEYNVGYSNATYQGDYVILSKDIVTEDGINGSIELTDLLRDITGSNLFNLEDYDRIRKEGNTGYKEYDIKNNTVMFGAKNGYVNYSYYLPEAYGKDVVMKFKAKYNKDSPNNGPVYIGRGFTQNLDYRIDNLTSEWKEYTFNFRMTTNYIGFVINETANQNRKTTVDFKDIQIICPEIYDTTRDNINIHQSNKFFSDPVIIAGDELMPDWHTNEKVLGNYGDGHARITRLSDNHVDEFNFNSDYYTFKAPINDRYKVELWGASGGDNVKGDLSQGSHAGRGAYTSGILDMSLGDTIYVYVGGKGSYGSGTNPFKGSAGGYNGGGYGGNANSGSGGGATDVRLSSGAWNNSSSLQSRIMVAAGGGGTDDSGGTSSGTLGGSNDGSGGAGGALSSKGAFINGVLNVSYGVGQIHGSFGVGNNATTNTDTGGTGGGYYGGNPSNSSAGGGAGGSSYISGYKGCVAYSKKDALIEKYTPYEENDQYKGRFNISIRDKRDEIVTKDWYVRIYRKGEYVKEYKYDLTSNNMENIEKTYGFDKNVNYTVVLSVKIRERYYDIDSVEFSTESEIRAIRTTNDFFNMHVDGKYIVLNDLDFSRINNGISYYFFGQVDFQGHHLIRNVLNSSSRLFENFRPGAVLKNVVVDYHLDNTTSRNWWYGLITYNYGTVDNIFLNVHDSQLQPNYIFSLISYVNYATIQNFVVNSKAPVSGLAGDGLITWSNQGVIRNGYIYGENMYAYHQNVDTRTRKDIGVIAGDTSGNSRIESVFSLISVEKNNTYGTGERESVVGNLIGYHGSGYLGDVYSVEFPDKTNTNILTQDPNIGKVAGIRPGNIYYVSDRTYGGTYSNKVSKLALYDKTFQNQTLNKYSGFDVDSFVDLGYFPQVRLNDCMPKQDWIELPKVTETDLIDVTSIEEIENNGDSALVKLHINNPSSEQITKVVISDINKVEIVNQVNSFGKTELTVKLSEPRAYKSRYYIDTLYIKPAYGSTYTKTYGKNERSINIDLYYPINNLNDWKVMVSNPSQNYALMTDLNFHNTSISQYVVNGTFSAKFDGRGHTISNITISSNNAMFNTLTGTIKNLNVENYNKTNKTSYGGFIYSSSSNALIDNVHMNKVRVHARDRIGGIVGYASQSTIKNSSVTDYVPMLYTDMNGNSLEDKTYEFDNIYVGALAGYTYLSFVENCYAQDINIEVTDVLSSLGVGGLIGRMESGTLQNAYATGTIKCNSVNVGGLVGWSTATISNVWSYVNTSTELDYVGGIVGKADNNNISNSLVFGAVYSSYVSVLGNNIHRTTGNSLPTVQSNYAWDKQKYYGLVTGESASEILLSAEQLQEENTYIDMIGFNNNFDYSQIENNVVPKLKNSETLELLPNQKDIVLQSELFDVKQTQVEKTASEADIYLVIENPNQYEITDIGFNYLKTSNARFTNVPSDGTTIINVHVVPERCYDTYTFSKVKYIDEHGEEKEYDKIVRIELQFFKTLDRYEVWQQISKKYAENYRLTADIDFSGKTNINTEVMFGRLEGQINSSGVNYKIKNFERNVTQSKTGLIKQITTLLKNVTFENITLNSNSSLSYINVIYLNYADIQNVEFNYITINTPKSSYVAPVGYHRGQNIDDVSIDHNNITGTRNVAGFMAYMYNTNTSDLSASNCNIYGTSSMVGGIIGEKPYINAYNSYRYYATNMNVTGQSYVGGLCGQGGAYGSTIEDSHITGISNGNYIGGISGYNNYEVDRDHTVRRCTIEAAGNYVGGIHGRALHIYNALIIDSSVTQTDPTKTYVGGAEGFHDGYTHSNYGVVNTTVTNAGDYTGGITGRLNSSPALTYSYTSNVTINGRNYVGGIAGYGNTSRAYQNVTNANITGSGNYIGGAFGYIASIHPSDSAYSAVIYEVLIANTTVTGSNNVGGFVGKTNNSQLTPAKFYNIIIVDNVTATANNPNVGAVNGDDNKNYPNTQLTTFRLYKNNKINGVSIGNQKPSNLASNYIVDSTNLKTQTFYTNFGFPTSRWNFTDINTYFPRVLTASSGTVAENQKKLAIPNGDVSFARMLKFAAPIGHELPTLTTYSSGINKINLEFNKSDDFSFFEVYENDNKILQNSINERTFTLNYDYNTKLKIVVGDGINSKTYEIKAGELRNLASTYGKNYAYIYQGKLKGNISNIKPNGKFIHLYKDLALTDKLEVYDISTGKKVDDSFDFDLLLDNNPTPLYNFDYHDTSIETYYNYSIIKKDGEDITYENQILVKDGAIEIIDCNLDSYHNMTVIDNYSNNNYVSVLGRDGTIYDLKSSISIPDNLSNKGILYMSSNIESDNSAIILIYKTGKVVVFDYRTGKEISTDKATENISILDYFKVNLKTTNPIIKKDISDDYKSALNLKNELFANPIVSDRKGGYTVNNDNNNNNDKDITKSINKNMSNYVTYYNAVREDYDILEVSSLLDSDDTTISEDDIITENNKIYTSNALIEYYMKESLIEKVFKNINGLYIFGALLLGILTALGLWIRNAKLLRTVEEVNNGKN